MRLKQYLLTEKTFRIGKDVDYIYNNFFKWRIKKLSDPRNIKEIYKTEYVTTGDLPSVEAKKAHKINPMRIKMGVFPGGNAYIPLNKTIVLTLNSSVIDLIRMHGDAENISSIVRPELKKAFESEINGVKIKNSIAHELSHWIDDTLHNLYITKETQKALELTLAGKSEKAIELRKHKHSSVNVTNYEREAQIHAIKQLKRLNRKIWDALSFQEMISLDGSLTAVYDNLMYNNKKEFKKWKKDILRRMTREKLLGKRMGR